MNFQSYSTESRYSARIKPEEWERHRDKITLLHSQNIPRRQMVEILKREDGFTPSLPQLNSKFIAWGLRKYEKSSSRSGFLTSETPSSPALRPNQPPTGYPLSDSMKVTNRLGAGRTADEEARVIVVSGGEQDEAEQRFNMLVKDSRAGYELSGEESSESGGAILTPNSTPKTKSRSSDPADAFNNGTPGIREHGLAARNNPLMEVDLASTLMSDSLMRRSREFQLGFGSRLRATSPYAIPPVMNTKDYSVVEHLLRNINDFAALMMNGKQRKQSTPEPREWDEIRRLQIKECINSTAQCYENAHYFLKLGEANKAIQRLRDSTSTVPYLFIEPDLFLLTRLVEIATWSSWKKFPEYEPIVFRYMSAQAEEKLGPEHPLTHLLECFAEAAAISTSYPKLWECVIENIDQMAAEDSKSRDAAQQIRIKAHFYLVRVLRNNREYTEAVQKCQALIQVCIAVDGKHSFSANRARYNLAVNHCEAGDINSAIEAYEDTRQYLGTSDCPNQGWVFAAFGTNEIAQLLEQKGNLQKAAEYYEKALVEFLQCDDNESSGALLMLKDLIDFHKRHNNANELAAIQSGYPHCCALLVSGRLDDARHWVGRRVTTQASGGKKNRPWTWTSPLV